MVTFRNNNNVRRNNFRRSDRGFKSNLDRPKYGSNFSKNENFQRKSPGRNNHNAPKLIDKYNDLAREALSNGDKILSENYLQHADHFTRVLNEKESFRKEKFSESRTENISDATNENIENPQLNSKQDMDEPSGDKTSVKKSIKPQVEIN